ncbi:hypothetical protein KY308_03790 [Candidatus Woesearchaeota archaeon]|nr:hypothetical protein [Candidatus Woesearchaeota archaeon]
MSDIMFQCKKCKYRFHNKNPDKKDAPKRCPWCDTENTVITLKSADEIVRDVDELLEEA